MERSIKKLALTAAALAVVAFLPAGAYAQPTTIPMEVTALVLNTCTVAAAPLAFVGYSAAGVDPNTASTQITVLTCFDPHEVAINGCTNGTGTANRRLKSVLSNDELDYQLSCVGDAKCTGNWGELQNVDTLTGIESASSLYTVNGVIPVNQQVQSGLYTDECTVSLQF